MMCYKSKFLIGSFAFLFMCASLSVEAMEERDRADVKNSIPRKPRTLFHFLKNHHSSLKNSQNGKDTVLKGDDTRDAIQLLKELKDLTNQAGHIERLRKVITKKAKEEIIISSEDVSDFFISELFISWVNRSERDLTITIYTTSNGEEIFKQATHNNTKFELNHTINIVSLDSLPSNILIMDQKLLVSTTYPWLASPRSGRENDDYAATVSRGEQAKQDIKKTKKELVKGRERGVRTIRASTLS